MLSKIRRCRKCHLYKKRHYVVLGRGIMPADVCFIGEAPGRSEDVLGEALVGHAGKLLDRLLRKLDMTYYITNTILCRPFDENDDPREPHHSEVFLCRNNVLNVVKKVKPKKVCFIGKIAERYYKKEFPDAVSISHPAFWMHTGGEDSMGYKEAERTLNAIN